MTYIIPLTVYIWSGFLSDGYDSVPGNFGISDVILALRWVQQAISDFGGNPRQVHGAEA